MTSIEATSSNDQDNRWRYVFDSFEIDLVRGQLTHNGEEIPLRPKSFAVLLHLLEHAGQLVPREQLMAAVWPGVVVTDDSIAQCLIELRRALGDTDRTMIRTVPRRGLIFETPVRLLDAAEPSPPAPSPRKKWNRLQLVTATVTVAVALLLWWPQSRGPSVPADRATPTPAPLQSIAVLPFVDMSPEGDQDYFADGISEEIINQLAQVPGLTVIARTSSFAFKNRQEDVRSIARQLNVAYLLEGSVRFQDDTARITAQLISADDGGHLWSQVYDRPRDDVFGVQSAIAGRVAESLHVEILADRPPARPHRPDPEAYRLVLEGQALYRQQAGNDMQRAKVLFQRATEIDPDYAIAWARLAAACRVLYFKGGMDYAEMIRTGLPAATRAVELRPDLAETQFRAGNMAGIVGDYETAERFYARATEIEPNHPFLLSHRAGQAVYSGRVQEAVEFQERAVLQDPLSPPEHVRMMQVLYHAGRFEAMREEAGIVSKLNPGQESLVASFLARAAIIEGKLDEAGSMVNAVEPGPIQDLVLALLARESGQAAFEALARLEAGESPEAAMRLAEAHAWMGDTETSFHALQKVRDRFEAAESPVPVYQFMLGTRISHFLAPLHDDPRWQQWNDSLPLDHLLNSKKAEPPTVAQESSRHRLY